MNLQLYVAIYLYLLFQATGAMQTSLIGGRGSDDSSASLLASSLGDQESNRQSGSLQDLPKTIKCTCQKKVIDLLVFCTHS